MKTRSQINKVVVAASNSGSERPIEKVFDVRYTGRTLKLEYKIKRVGQKQALFVWRERIVETADVQKIEDFNRQNKEKVKKCTKRLVDALEKVTDEKKILLTPDHSYWNGYEVSFLVEKVLDVKYTDETKKLEYKIKQKGKTQEVWIWRELLELAPDVKKINAFIKQNRQKVAEYTQLLKDGLAQMSSWDNLPLTPAHKYFDGDEIRYVVERVTKFLEKNGEPTLIVFWKGYEESYEERFENLGRTHSAVIEYRNKNKSGFDKLYNRLIAKAHRKKYFIVSEDNAVTTSSVLTTSGNRRNPVRDPTADRAAKRSADSAAEPSLEPVAKRVADPTADRVAEPVAEPAAEPVAEPFAEPVANPVAEPAGDPAALKLTLMEERKKNMPEFTCECYKPPRKRTAGKKRSKQLSPSVPRAKRQKKGKKPKCPCLEFQRGSWIAHEDKEHRMYYVEAVTYLKEMKKRYDVTAVLKRARKLQDRDNCGKKKPCVTFAADVPSSSAAGAGSKDMLSDVPNSAPVVDEDLASQEEDGQPVEVTNGEEAARRLTMERSHEETNNSVSPTDIEVADAVEDGTEVGPNDENVPDEDREERNGIDIDPVAANEPVQLNIPADRDIAKLSDRDREEDRGMNIDPVAANGPVELNIPANCDIAEVANELVTPLAESDSQNDAHFDDESFWNDLNADVSSSSLKIIPGFSGGPFDYSPSSSSSSRWLQSFKEAGPITVTTPCGFFDISGHKAAYDRRGAEAAIGRENEPMEVDGGHPKDSHNVQPMELGHDKELIGNFTLSSIRQMNWAVKELRKNNVDVRRKVILKLMNDAADWTRVFPDARDTKNEVIPALENFMEQISTISIGLEAIRNDVEAGNLPNISHLAVQIGSIELMDIVRRLPGSTDTSGKTSVIDVAFEQKHVKMFRHLLQNGASTAGLEDLSDPFLFGAKKEMMAIFRFYQKKAVAARSA